MPKRKTGSEDEKDTKKARTVEYDFFHDKSESAKKDVPLILSCNGEQWNVFPQILKVCSPRYDTHFDLIEHDNRTYVNLDALNRRGVQVFADYGMDHQKPKPIAINEDEGDIVDDTIDCYITALKLRAHALCDLILHQACEVGREHELVIRHSQILKTYAETKREDNSLRAFVTSLVAYQKRNGLKNAITGRDPQPQKQRLRFAALPKEFQFDLMHELSKNTAGQNPCYRPNRFHRVISHLMETKERDRAAAEKARLEQAGKTREEPLFVEESDDE